LLDEGGVMKEIALTRGKVAIVDDEDLSLVSGYKWHTQKGPATSWYARTTMPGNGKQVHIYMHKLLMRPGQGEVVDFIDGNGLNLVRANMRVGTRSQDGFNRHSQRNNKSGFKGVCWGKKENKWCAFINVARRRVRLSVFSDINDAARTYDNSALAHYGEFARLNFPTNDRKDLICASSSSPSSLVASSEPGLLSRFFSRLKNLLKNILPWRS
jgi:hypothetical protein